MIVAAVAAGREPQLRKLLGSMNLRPGVCDPANELLPFADFERLHFARLVILGDTGQGAIDAPGLAAPPLPVCLAFIGDCDGPARDFLDDLVHRAGAGLRKLFDHCDGFDANGALLPWMLAHDCPAAAVYVNWVGRSVQQIREESALHRALGARAAHEPGRASADPQTVRRDLVGFVNGELRAGRLALTPPEPTPLGWQLAKLVHAIAVPLVGLLALPLFIVLLPLLVYQLRRRETTDPDTGARPQPEAVQRLQALEDFDVTNQFSVIGRVKPGRFRRWTMTVLLVLLEYACRHIYSRGHLTRLQTIHFARWTFLDNKTRIVFASNYDGSVETYMDDFINKVAWGLNLVFSNGTGYPHTDWLVMRGARAEQHYKYCLRRHQLPTEVWYKAYPGLTVVDLTRNLRIRQGLERAVMTDEQAVAWLRLL